MFFLILSLMGCAAQPPANSSVTVAAASTPSNSSLPTPSATPEIGVTFVDPAFEYSVRLALQKQEGPITQEDALSITRLKIRSVSYETRAKSLADLKWFPNLRTLEIEYQNIKSLQGIQAAKSLESFTLYSNGDSYAVMPLQLEISLLSELKSLRELTLSIHQIEDTSPLAELTGLQSLFLVYDSPSLSSEELPETRSVEALYQLKNLKHLSISFIEDIGFLINMPELVSLSLSYCDIGDFSPLAALRRLEMLSIKETPLKEGEDGLAVIGELHTLTELTLRNGNISNMDFIEGLSNLRSLDLSYNPLKNTDALAKLTHLTKLTMYNCGLTDISFMRPMTEMEELWISDNMISDLSALADMTRLSTFTAGRNQITDLSPIHDLPQLWDIYLESNKISDEDLERFMYPTGEAFSRREKMVMPISSGGFDIEIALDIVRVRNSYSGEWMIKGLTIRRTDTKAILFDSLVNTMFHDEHDGYGVFFEDMNFDGYMDFHAINEYQGAQMAASHWAYLYDPVEGLYQRCPVAGISNLTVDPVYKRLRGSNRNHAASHTDYTYKFEGDQFELEGTLTVSVEFKEEAAADNREAYSFYEEREIDGKMVVVADFFSTGYYGIFDDERANEYYRSGSYWSLENEWNIE